MSHYTVLICLGKDEIVDGDVHSSIERALAPFDENMEVPEYRSYVEGSPDDHWSANGVRETLGLDDDEPLTWAQLVEGYSIRHEGDDDKLHLDPLDGRAYNVSTYNPSSKWDWWTVGGRWGFSLVSKLHASDAEVEKLVFGEPGAFGYAPHQVRMRTDDATIMCDGGPVRLLDFQRMRMEAEERARKRWAHWMLLVGKYPALEWTWSQLIELVTLKNITIDEARQKYREQPLINAVQSNEALRELLGIGFMTNIEEEFYSTTGDEYAQRAYYAGVTGWALLTKDGEWKAPGDMGWFGMSSDTPGTRDAYRAEFNKYLDSLDFEDYVVLVDCHI